MAGMAGVTFSVTAEELERKAEEVTQFLSTMEGSYDTLKGMIHGTSGYWEGEAAQTYRSIFQEKEADVQEVLRRLKEHPSKLLEMAGIYKSTEQTVTEENLKLPENPLG